MKTVIQFHKTYKYRLYPTDSQKEQLSQCFAAARHIYNAALEQRSLYNRAKGTDKIRGENQMAFNKFSQRKQWQMRQLKNDPELSWMTLLPSDAVENTLADLEIAFDKFFSGGGYPTFKTMSRNNSFKLAAAKYKLINKDGEKPLKELVLLKVVFGKNSVRIPNLGRIAYNKHIRFYGNPKTVSITMEGNEYYVILTTQHERAVSKNGGETLGVDLGVHRPVTLSTGEFITKDLGLQALSEKKKEAQKVLSRRKKGSNRRAKAKAQLNAIEKKIARRRKARMHGVTTEIVRRAKKVAIEDLRVKNMTSSAKGTKESPGKNVKAKAGLNREILNVGFYEFRSQLEYKGKKYGTEVVAVPPQYTSRTCSSCGHEDKMNRTTQSGFICTSCGFTANADENAAINILMLAGEPVGAKLKKGTNGVGGQQSSKGTGAVVGPRKAQKSSTVGVKTDTKKGCKSPLNGTVSHFMTPINPQIVNNNNVVHDIGCSYPDNVG